MNGKEEGENLLKVDELEETHRSYELEEAGFRLDAWYKIYKEESFLRYIFGRTPLKGVILEVGGGTGFQGKVISKFVNGLYLHTDYSFLLCRWAKRKGLLSVQMDGLKLAVGDQSIDEIITIAVSTIIRSKVLRQSQFNEFHRAIKKKGYLYMVTNILYPMKGMHCIDKADIEYLQKLGFKKVKILYWGVIPGRFWKSYSSRILGMTERVFARFSIGTRKIVILQKIK